MKNYCLKSIPQKIEQLTNIYIKETSEIFRWKVLPILFQIDRLPVF